MLARHRAPADRVEVGPAVTSGPASRLAPRLVPTLASRLAPGLARVETLDSAVARRLRATDHPALDSAMRGLSRAGDHSRLWAGVAGVLWLSDRPHLRRAAVAGLAAGASASLVVNQGIKRAVPRTRPSPHLVDARRRLRRTPRTGSFPSGHAASAAAFVTGVAVHAPTAALPLAPLAGAVALSRVHTGVHFFSDVVVGAGVGSAVAVLLAAGPRGRGLVRSVTAGPPPPPRAGGDR